MQPYPLQSKQTNNLICRATNSSSAQKKGDVQGVWELRDSSMLPVIVSMWGITWEEKTINHQSSEWRVALAFVAWLNFPMSDRVMLHKIPDMRLALCVCVCLLLVSAGSVSVSKCPSLYCACTGKISKCPEHKHNTFRVAAEKKHEKGAKVGQGGRDVVCFVQRRGSHRGEINGSYLGLWA